MVNTVVVDAQDVDDLSGAELEAVITRWAGSLAAATCRWLLFDRPVRRCGAVEGVGL